MKRTWIISCALLACSFVNAQITVDTTFEGANAKVLLIDDSTNTIRIEANKRYGDVFRVTFNMGISGFNTGVPLKIQVKNTSQGHLPVLAGYSYDQVNWMRLSGTYINNYKEYTHTFSQAPVYFATGFPYMYNDVISLAGSLIGNPAVAITDVAISEQGRPVKMFRFTEPCVPDSGKALIWLVGRNHAMESHSSHVVEGLIQFLASGEYKADMLRRQAIVYVVPMMDVDMVYAGGTGKDQMPVDFNRDWDAPSYWNAIIGVKNMMLQSALANPLLFFVDSHNPFPGQNDNNTWFFSMYASGPKSDNLDFYRKLLKDNGGYPVNRKPAYSTIGQTARSWVDSMNTGIDFSVTLETGWVDRTDNIEWTIPLYHQHGKVLGQGMCDYVSNAVMPNDIIVDNSDTSGVLTITGQWNSSTVFPGYWGTEYIHDDNTGQGTKSVLFEPVVPAAGDYELFMRWTSDANRADSVPVRISYQGGIKDTIVNQQAWGAGWVTLGVYPFASGNSGSVLISNDNTVGYVIADAMRLSPRDLCSTVSLPEEAVGRHRVRIYPNPAQRQITIEHPGLSSGELLLFDMTGRNLIRTVLRADLTSLDISLLPPGMYFIRIEDSLVHICEKLVVE